MNSTISKMAKVLPDFSNITFLPRGKQAIVNLEKKTDLLRFFQAVINKEKLEVDETLLEQMFCQDLTINTQKLDKRLVAVLAEALVYYMTVWPGWQRGNEYYNGQLPCMEWYERFRQYLIFKSNFIIKNASKFATDTHNETSTTSTESQTTVASINKGVEKKVAPYVLCVGGPPSVLNNVVFMESNGDVLIKQHMEKPWREKLSLKEFLNWVHVSVEVNLPDVSLTRSNTHTFERYIALCGDLTLLPEGSHIKYIKKTSPDAELQPYSYEFFYSYFQQLFKLFKTVPGVTLRRLQELDAIFTEFLDDVKEVNVYGCTMCTDISIGYHIGKCKYIRNKKMVSSDPKKKQSEQNTINFYEILLPQVEFTLKTFNAVQDATDNDVSFEGINKIMKLIKLGGKHPDVENLQTVINHTCLVYKCTLCSETFDDCSAHSKLIEHFAKNHKDEQALLCFKCRKEFQVHVLTGNRWKHYCVDGKRG